MVAFGNGRNVSENSETPRRISAECTGCSFTDRELLFGEFAGLVENGIGNSEFANVVQQRGAAQPCGGRWASRPSSSAIRSVKTDTRSLWPLVNGLLESITLAKAVAMSSM